MNTPRRAFLPKKIIDIYNSKPFMSALIKREKRRVEMENEKPVTVPIETANYLLKQIIELNKIIEIQNERIDVQAETFKIYEKMRDKWESEIKKLKSQLKSKKEKK